MEFFRTVEGFVNGLVCIRQFLGLGFGGFLGLDWVIGDLGILVLVQKFGIGFEIGNTVGQFGNFVWVTWEGIFIPLQQTVDLLVCGFAPELPG